MKPADSIPDPALNAADNPAEGTGVQDHDDDSITAKLNEIYATESSTLDPVFQSIQSRSMKKGE